MAVILVPNTVQLKMFGSVQGIPWVSLLHFSVIMPSGAITAAVLNAMCNKVQSDLSPRIVTDFPTSVTLTGVTGVDLSTNTPQVGNSTGSAINGGGAGMQDSAASLVINAKTGSRYRGGHGRIYLPGLLTSLQANANTWTNAIISTWTTAFNLTINDTITAAVGAGATSAASVIPRYLYRIDNDTVHSKYVRVKTGWSGNDVVFNWVPRPKIGSQRRRLG